MAVFRTHFEILTFNLDITDSIAQSEVLYKLELFRLLLASFPGCRKLYRKLERSLGLRIVITAT